MENNSTPATVRAPLPAPPVPPANATRDQYRASLALYLLIHLPNHGALATAALDDDQLEEAARGLHAAICHRPIVIAEQTTPIVVYDAIARTQAFVRLMQDGRAKDAAATTPTALDALPSAGIDSHPRNGKTVPIPDLPQPRVPPAAVAVVERSEWWVSGLGDSVNLSALRQRVQEAF